MADFTIDGYTYDLWIKPKVNRKTKYEALRWKTGLKKATWERIPYSLYLKMKKKWKNR